MFDDLKPFGDDLKPLAGFEGVDESKLANVTLRLANGLRLDRAESPRAFAVLSRAKAAREQLQRLPGPRESIHCILKGDFALADFVPTVVELSGHPIERLRIATLGFSKRNVSDLMDLRAAGLVGHIDVLCSHYFAASSAEIYRHAVESFAGTDCRIVAMRTHAKVMLMNAGPATLVVESSANLRSCHNVEQATLINDPDLFAFHAGWIDELITAGANQPPPKPSSRRNRK